MPIVNDLLTGNRWVGPSVFLHLNWHATEICMPYKNILRFRDLPTSVARSLGSNKKLIKSMSWVPKSSACQNQSLECFKRAGLFLESTAILTLAKKT